MKRMCAALTGWCGRREAAGFTPQAVAGGREAGCTRSSSLQSVAHYPTPGVELGIRSKDDQAPPPRRFPFPLDPRGTSASLYHSQRCHHPLPTPGKPLLPWGTFSVSGEMLPLAAVSTERQMCPT